MSRRAHLLLPAAAALGLALAALPGCQNNDMGHSRSTRTSSSSMSTSNATTSSMRDTRAMNQQTANDLLREAQDAERQGNDQHAMEVYQYLRGFPENSRPRDIEQRIDRLRTRMNQSGAT